MEGKFEETFSLLKAELERLTGCIEGTMGVMNDAKSPSVKDMLFTHLENCIHAHNNLSNTLGILLTRYMKNYVEVSPELDMGIKGPVESAKDEIRSGIQLK